VIPSGDVITELRPSLEGPTATKRPLPKATENHGLSEGVVAIFHVIPSLLYMALFPEPLVETATKTPLP
jgi:hypothetical protein